MRSRVFLSLFAGITVLLSACASSQQAAAPTSAPAPTATVMAATPVPATIAPIATAAPTAAATAEPPVATAIPRGKTAEGYNYLGSPDAPVVFQDFSDFF